MIFSKNTYLAILFITFLFPHLLIKVQEPEQSVKKDDIYNNYLKIKNNLTDEKFWSTVELIKEKQKIEYNEFDDVKKNLIKQIIVRSCRNALLNKITEFEKEKEKNKEKEDLISKYKSAVKDLDNIDKKLRIDLYEIKPEWFTDLDKEIFLEIKK